jgi:RNA polymerase sigma-70 factor (ECF subfamily)
VSRADPLEKPSLFSARVLGRGSEPAVEDAARPTLRALFEAHYASIWRLLRRFGVPPAELDDTAQEVFWVAARRFSDIVPGREHPFLYGVALRVASNVLRRRERAAPVAADWAAVEDLADARPSPEQALEERRARELMDWVLQRLPLELRTVFVLFELEGLAIRDIAELEEIPVGTASSRLRRAREEFSATSKRLRAVMASGRGSR